MVMIIRRHKLKILFSIVAKLKVLRNNQIRDM